MIHYNGDALAVNNKYSDNEYLNDELLISSSKEISVFVYENTEISFFWDEKGIEIL